MSWTVRDDGYDLFFNRDERRSRLPATAPQLRESGKRHLLTPSDGEAGGSWVAANACGITVALLNGYRSKDELPRAEGWTSRGRLVLDLAVETSVRAVQDALLATDLANYRSFRIFVLAPGEVRSWQWNDGRLEVSPTAAPAVSSSFRFDAVRGAREALFRELVGSSVAERRRRLLDFHRSHRPRRGPFSPCMHRDDAHTVSFTWVTVNATEVSMRYCPQAPCRAWPPGEPCVLRRREPSIENS